MHFIIKSVCLFLIIIPMASSAQTDTLKVADSSDSSEYRIFEKVEIEATFPGGDDAWRKYRIESRCCSRILRNSHSFKNCAYDCWARLVAAQIGIKERMTRNWKLAIRSVWADI